MDEKIKEWKSQPRIVTFTERGQLIDNLLSRLKELENQILRMIRGEFKQICCYCGWESQEGEWGELETHIKECPFHPLGKAEARVKELEEGIEKAVKKMSDRELRNLLKKR